MSDNSRAMSLEEKLVQTIKDRELYALIADEDAITKLVERAIQEALYQPTRTTDSYGRVQQEKDSPLVDAARSLAKEVANKVAQREVEKLIADETTGPLIRKFVVDAIPQAMAEAMIRQLQALANDQMRNIGALHSLAQRLGVSLA